MGNEVGARTKNGDVIAEYVPTAGLVNVKIFSPIFKPKEAGSKKAMNWIIKWFEVLKKNSVLLEDVFLHIDGKVKDASTEANEVFDILHCKKRPTDVEVIKVIKLRNGEVRYLVKKPHVLKSTPKSFRYVIELFIDPSLATALLFRCVSDGNKK